MGISKAVVDGLANMIMAVGIPKTLTLAISSVFVASLAGTIWTVAMNQFRFSAAHNFLLQVVNFGILVIAIWIVIEGLGKLIVPGDQVMSRLRWLPNKVPAGSGISPAR